jgi:predicted transcriptional regulator
MFRSSQPKGLELKRFLNPRQPVLTIANQDLIVTNENNSIKSVTDLMLNRYRRIPLVTNNMKLTGMVTIIDVLDFLGGGEKFKIYSQKPQGINLSIKHIKKTNIHHIHPNSSVIQALRKFKLHGKGAFPLVLRGEVKGMISEWDFVNSINQPVDMSVEELMTSKPIIANKEYSVWDAAKMMCRGGFRRLPVTEQGILMGIVTPYDILSYLARGERVSKFKLQNARVKNVMNKFVTTIELESSIDEAVELMRNKKVGGLPVIEDEELVGIITERDILNALMH